jgi:hypothetical protein
VLSTDEISPVFLYMLTVSLPSRTFTVIIIADGVVLL